MMVNNRKTTTLPDDDTTKRSDTEPPMEIDQMPPMNRGGLANAGSPKRAGGALRAFNNRDNSGVAVK